MEDSQGITSCESYYSLWIISAPSYRVVNVRLRAELLLGMLTVVFTICSPKWNKLWAWAAWNTAQVFGLLTEWVLFGRKPMEIFLFSWMSVLPSPRSICRKSSLQKWKWLQWNSLPRGGLQLGKWPNCTRLFSILLSTEVSLKILYIPKEARP